MDKKKPARLVSSNPHARRKSRPTVEELVNEGAMYWLEWAIRKQHGEDELAELARKKAKATTEARIQLEAREAAARKRLRVVSPE